MKQKYSKLLEVFHLLINATMSLIVAITVANAISPPN